MKADTSEIRHSVDIMRSVAQTALREIRECEDDARARQMALLGFAEIEAEASHIADRLGETDERPADCPHQSADESVKLAFSGI